MNKRFNCYLAVGAILMASVASPANASHFSNFPLNIWEIDSSQSSLEWGGAIILSFFELDPQTPGSNISVLSGTIDATVSGPFGAENIAFGGEGVIDLADLGVVGLPPVGNVATSDDVAADGTELTGHNVADDLFTAGETNVLLSSGPAAATVAFRELQLNLGGSAVSDGSAATAVEVGILQGWLAANTSIAGADAIEAWLGTGGVTTPNDASITGAVTYTLVGSIPRITIPIQLTFGDVTTDGFELTVVGQIVAIRPIPEPTSALFLASLAAGTGAIARRRRK